MHDTLFLSLYSLQAVLYLSIRSVKEGLDEETLNMDLFGNANPEARHLLV